MFLLVVNKCYKIIPKNLAMSIDIITGDAIINGVRQTNPKQKERTMKTAIKVGDQVTPVGKSIFVRDLAGLVGEVVNVFPGACGRIVAVRFAGSTSTYDLAEKKVKRFNQ